MPTNTTQQLKQGAGDHIKVVIRSRPLNEAEIKAQTPSLVSCDAEHNQVHVSMHSTSKRSKKTYNFDKVSLGTGWVHSKG